MPTAADLYVVDEAHRVAQARSALAVAVQVARAWRAVNPDDLRGTSSAFLDTSLQALEAGHQRSLDYAGGYIRRTAAVQGVSGRLTLPEPPAFNVEQARTSLTFLGPSSVGKQSGRWADEGLLPGVPGAPPIETERVRDRIMERAAIQIVGAAIRLVQDAGRDFVDRTHDSERRVVGYVRITRDRPCYFCAALASRGPVYKEDSFSRSDPRFEGPGNHKVHDHCQCAIRPLYSRSTFQYPENNRRFLEIWRDHSGDEGYKDSMNAFRAAYERMGGVG